MAYTMQQVVDKARIPLNDAAKTRNSDTELLGYANDARLILRQRRPDLFFGNYLAALSPLVITADFDLDDSLYLAVADYVSARAESKDDEEAVMAKAAMFFGLFKAQIE